MWQEAEIAFASGWQTATLLQQSLSSTGQVGALESRKQGFCVKPFCNFRGKYA